MTYIITDYKSNVCLWQQYKLAFYVLEKSEEGVKVCESHGPGLVQWASTHV